MADPEQIEQLKRNVQEWNQWRREQPDLRLDLRGVDLIDADLEGVNLSNVILAHADLEGVNLSNSDLSNTSLSNADLSNAILDHALLTNTDLWSAQLNGATLRNAYLLGVIFRCTDLSETNLSGAIFRLTSLRDTNLSRANLSGASFKKTSFDHTNLSGADLSGADFTEAHFFHTIFAEVNLNNVKGLGAAIHRGPSTVNINSATLPHDKPTRLHFLRGVGFTETQIEYLPSLLTPHPIQYHSIFISYAYQDEVLAKRLYTDLRKNDVPCWFAPHDLQPGNFFREGIDRAIHAQDKLFLLLSEHSVKSGWVRYEVELALARENREQRECLFPIRLDEAIFQCTAGWATSLRETRHIGNFTSWQDDGAYQLAFAALLRHLKVTKAPTL